MSFYEFYNGYKITMFHHLNSITKIVVTLSSVIISYLALKNEIFIPMQLLALIMIIHTRPHKWVVLTTVGIGFMMTFTTALTWLFTAPQIEAVYWSWGPLNVSWFGIWMAILLAQRFMIGPLFACWLVTTTSMSDFVYGMTVLKLPTTLGAIIAMMIRLIPGMLTDLRRVKDAQTSRGMEMDKVNIVTKVARYIYLILPIMSLTFRRVDTLSRTVEVRGLRKTPRWVYKQPKLKKRDYAIIIACITLCIITIYLYTFYPEYIMDYADYWRGRGLAVT